MKDYHAPPDKPPKSSIERGELYATIRPRLTHTALQFRIGVISRSLTSRPFGHCYKCLTTWAFVDGHTTWYGDHSGCFPLCRLCWAELTPEERLPLYAELVAEWLRQSHTNQHRLDILRQWPEIERAVLAGL